MRILIVEDEPNLGRQLKSTLEQTGYAVDLASDGEEGHFLGATENYDAVILDLGLPEIDGLTVLDRWRKEGRTTPVLVLTARDSWSDKVAGLDAGADDYLAKPFNFTSCGSVKPTRRAALIWYNRNPSGPPMYCTKSAPGSTVYLKPSGMS